MPEYRSNFTCAFQNVATARRAIVAFAAHWFSGGDLADIECAAGEALANSAEHGSKTGGGVDVRCEFDSDRLVIEVKDTGDGFDRWHAADHLQPLAEASRGYGIYIMRELMEEVQYAERGTRVRLVKLRRARAQDGGQEIASRA